MYLHPLLVMSLIGVLLAGCSDGKSADQSADADLQGSISIESRTRIDDDTADDIFTGQGGANSSAVVSLPSGAVVAGYLSAVDGAYATGIGDSFDYYPDGQDNYAVNLGDEDRLSVQVFGSPESYVAGLADPLITVTVEAGGTQQISDQIAGYGTWNYTVGVDGTDRVPHTVRISADSGAPFRYVLTVINKGSSQANSFSYSEPAFQADEAVVVMDEQRALTSGASAVLPANANARALGKGAWQLRRPSDAASSGTKASSSPATGEKTLEWIRELRERPGILHAEPNYLFRTQQGPTTEDEDLYRQQWGLPLVQVPLSWQLAPALGSGVGIAVMDTGLFTRTPRNTSDWHGDLDENVRLVSGQTMDFVSSDLDIDSRFGDPIGRDSNPADPGDGKPQSSNFHGTHVAGIIAAADNGEGILGVAPAAHIYPVRVLGEDGVGSSADLIAAINWAAGRSQINVINLSLGGVGNSSVLQAAIDNAVNRGKLVVAAAGNQGSDEATYPAAYGNVVGVGAVDGAGKRASYSNMGASVDVVAPGGDVLRDANQDGSSDLIISTWGLDDGGNFREAYAGLQGTSMAAPHVAGLYALMKAEQLSLGPQDFMNLLRDGQLTVAPPNRSEYGNGLIDAVKSVNAALGGQVPTVLGAQPTVLQFTRALVRQEVRLTVYSDNESVTIDDVVTSAGWLEAELDQASMTLQVTARTEGLGEGQTRQAQVTVSYAEATDGKPLTIPVTQQSGDALDDRNAGRHYVLLVSTDDAQETVRQAVVEAEAGQYSFAFNDVPTGEYFLVAGTDTDNNGLICESGEACAEYPVNGLPEPIVYNGRSLQGLTFSTSFRRPAISALGLPRYGFEGYRVKSAGDTVADKQVKIAD